MARAGSGVNPEGSRKRPVGIGLLQQRLGLGLKGLNCVSSSGEAHGWLFQSGQMHDC
jgi:hypothetical protein